MDMEGTGDIVVVMPNWIGDVVMATPLLRALRRRFSPRQKLVGVMRPYVASVLANEPWFDEVILQDRRGQRGGLRFWPLAKRLRASRPDTVILLASSLRFGLLAWLSGARRRVGYRRNLRGWTLTHSYELTDRREDGSKSNVVEQYLALGYAVGCEPELPQPELTVSAEDEAGADLVWNNLGFAPRHRVVALNPGSTNGSARNWEPARLAELARRLVESHGDVRVLVLCGPSERETADQIAGLVDRPQVRTMSQQDMRLGVTMACLRRATALVTGDHGFRHIAAAFGTPTVCLEGPIDGEWTYSYNPYEIRVRADLPCMPCGKLECPLGHKRCMSDLTVDRVYAAVVERLAPRRLMQVA